MAVRSSLLMRPSLWKTILTQGRLTMRLLREPRVPMITKTLPFLVLGYVVSPLDFIPDVIPIVGQLDDLGILAIGITVFLKLCPGDAVHFHRASIEASRPYTPMPAGGEIIDAEFRRQ